MISDSSAASLSSPVMPSRSMVMVAPTISRWLNSSVAMSMSMSYLSGCGWRAPKAWTKYCMAAASSPLAPPNCSRRRRAKRGSGAETRALNWSSLT